MNTSTWVIFAIAIAIVAVIAWQVGKRRGGQTASQQPEPEATAPKDPFATVSETAGDPRAMKAGDMVEYLGRQYFVRGSLRLREGGFTWSEHILDADTDGQKTWISVEEDPDLEVVWWTERDADELLPDQKTITFEGVEYRRTEHSTADYRS